MKQLMDFFPVLVFAGVYFVTDDMITATAFLIGASAVQLVVSYAINRTVEKIHLYTFLVLLVFGGFTLLLDDPVYIKWKPTVVNGLFAIILLGSQFIGEKPLIERLIRGALSQAPDIRLTVPDTHWRWINLAWVIFFLLVGALNLYVAFNYPEPTWVKFKLIGLTLLNLGFMLLQFGYLARYMEERPKESSE